MSTTNTHAPPWEDVEFRARCSLECLCIHLHDAVIQWHVRNRREVLPELSAAFRATHFREFRKRLPEGDCSLREHCQHAREHIRAVAPQVKAAIRVLLRTDSRVCSVVAQRLVRTWRDCLHTRGEIKSATVAHDRAMDELFNPRAST